MPQLSWKCAQKSFSSIPTKTLFVYIFYLFENAVHVSIFQVAAYAIKQLSKSFVVQQVIPMSKLSLIATGLFIGELFEKSEKFDKISFLGILLGYFSSLLSIGVFITPAIELPFSNWLEFTQVLATCQYTAYFVEGSGIAYLMQPNASENVRKNSSYLGFFAVIE